MDMKELDRRIKLGVRNIKISPLFEKGKLYSLSTYLEDENGTLRPEYTHCWLSWQSKWFDGAEQKFEWSNEAYCYPTLAEAEVGRSHLEKFLAA